MKSRFNQAPRVPRKMKKTYLKYIRQERVSKRDLKRLKLGGNRNLADLSDRCQAFVQRCLEAAWAVGSWDGRLFD